MTGGLAVRLPVSVDMSNPDFGSTFTNNNYIPGIGQFRSVQQSYPAAVLTGDPTIIPVTAVPSVIPVTAPVGGFTFTVPTQGSALTATLTQPRQSQGIYSCAGAVYLQAPGTGASWQHCVPFQRTGTFGNTIMPSAQRVSVFGKSSVSSSVRKTSSSGNPSTERLKRRSTGNIGAPSPSSKMFITEKKMLAHMRELRISSPPSVGEGIISAFADTMTQQSPPITSQALLNNTWSPITSQASLSNTRSPISESWRKLQEIEDRLEISDEEEEREGEDNCRSSMEDRSLPQLYLDESVSRQIRSTSNIIPKKILEDMNKPCMQIVLWKPPGLVKDELEEQSPEEILHISNGPIQEVPAHRSVPTSSSNMDLDMFDNCDDDMQL